MCEKRPDSNYDSDKIRDTAAKLLPHSIEGAKRAADKAFGAQLPATADPIGFNLAVLPEENNEEHDLSSGAFVPFGFDPD